MSEREAPKAIARQILAKHEAANADRADREARTVTVAPAQPDDQEGE